MSRRAAEQMGLDPRKLGRSQCNKWPGEELRMRSRRPVKGPPQLKNHAKRTLRVTLDTKKHLIFQDNC